MTQRYRVMNEDLRPSYLGFHDLMRFRVERILLVASLYDSFVLEEDGRLTDRIFSDYRALSLNSPPRVTPVRSVAKALETLEQGSFDLVVTMLRLPDQNTATLVREIKARYPKMPVILLTWDRGGLGRQQQRIYQAGLDQAFLWTGDTSIFLALVKFVEDMANLDADVAKGDVRLVVVVEDSIRYFSTFLPVLYQEIMSQTQALIDEGLNDIHKLYRMRARPKLALVNSFEDALAIFARYSSNVLGFLSDIRFPRGGKLDPQAGFHLVNAVRKEVPDLPFLLLSAEPSNAERARALSTSFLDKNSPKLAQRVRRFLKIHLGFGDFVFRNPAGQELARAKDLAELIERLHTIPADSMLYHAKGNHFSNWVAARGEFALARSIRPTKLRSLDAVEELRTELIQRLARGQEDLQRGVISDLGGTRYHPSRTFSRLGTGSLGGKSRSVAFLGALLERAHLEEVFPNVRFGVPRTVALGANVFEEFIEHNELDALASSDLSDLEIAQEFLKGNLPDGIKAGLSRVLKVIHYPLAVRSSSLLEDSPDHPFAGVFHTHMLPNNHPSVHVRLYQLCRAIKLVYASTWFNAARGYLKATGHNPLDQKMGVAIQQLVGRHYGNLFYPCVSGVAQTYNFYPLRYLEPEDGVAIAALGLGRTITDGATALRFCPKHPEVVPQLALTRIVDDTQRKFWALDLSKPETEIRIDESYPLVELGIEEAEADGTLTNLASVLCPQDDRLRDGLSSPGLRLVTLAPVLKWKVFPLAEILSTVLDQAHDAMAGPAEIEYSVVIKGDAPEFNLLQIRPLTVAETSAPVDMNKIPREKILLRSTRALGHGAHHVHDLVYVRKETFRRTKTSAIAREVARCNASLCAENRPFILLGPGRWGTNDPMVGIPVRWDEVSGAKLIAEVDVPGFEVEPSQGNHFFHNLTSYHVCMMTISFRVPDKEHLDWKWLEAQPATWTGRYVRHLRFKQPLKVLLDGRSSFGLVARP